MEKIEEKIKYFIYARKSSESDERQIQSIDDQVLIMTGVAKNYNLKVADTITESKSAKEPNGRPEFEKMMKRIKNGEAQGILVWKIDRLSRNPIDSAVIQWLLQKEVIASIRTPDREYRPEDNALLLSVESSMANQFIRDLSKNVKRGLKSKIDKGWMPSIAPSGYLNTKIEAQGERYIIKDPERFPLVRRAWDLMLTGNHTPPKILDMLNEWGFRTPRTKRRGGKPMSYSTIYKIFTNQFYAGLIPYSGQIFQGQHEPMVTLEEFDRVQVLLGRKGKPRPKTHVFAFTGCIRCAECGCLITAIEKIKFIKRDKKTKTYVFYHCTRRKKSAQCSQRKELTLDKLELQIEMEIEKYTILPEFRDWALEILNEHNDTEINDRSKIYESQLKDLAASQNELDELTRMRYRSQVTDDFFNTEKAALQKKIVRLKDQLRDTEKRAENWLELSERTFNFALYARKAFVMGDMTAKREILRALGENPLLNDQKLSVYAYEWLQRIENGYPELKAEFEALEPTKMPMDTARSEALASIRTRWYHHRDLNPSSRRERAMS
jgi:site-specific DNA recombinase